MSQTLQAIETQPVETQAIDPGLIEKLSQHHRDILLATGTYKEIAASLGIPLGTVRSRLNRARKAAEAIQESGDRVA